MTAKQQVTLATTGGSGFVARGLIERCAEVGVTCRALSRSSRPSWAPQATQWATLDYRDLAANAAALAGVDYLVHLADNASRGEDRDVVENEKVNSALIDGMRQAAVKGVVVASSVYARDVSVLGSYGWVKQSTERQFLAESDLNPIILRLPPVYGPGGKGGLAVLTELVRRRLPLPFGLATEPRAYLSRSNLVSLILTMTDSPQAWRAARGRIFEPSDGQAITTRELTEHVAGVMGISTFLLPVPPGLMRSLAGLVGRRELAAGSLDPLCVEPVAELETAFGWRPVEGMPQSLAFLRTP